METNEAAILLSILGHAGRLDVYRLLARRAPRPVRAGELARALDLKPNTLSVYVGALERVGLVRSKRAGKSVLYELVPERMNDLTRFIVGDCCRSRPELCDLLLTPLPFTAAYQEANMADHTYNVLFICTGNSARSIIAETLLNEEGNGKFRAYSAGTKPAGEVNPFARDLLERSGHDVSTLRSKNVDEYKDIPEMDFVFTVCDQAANEECPIWPGHPMTAHWGLPDPAKVEGSDAQKAVAFAKTYAQMRRRVLNFSALPIETLDRLALQAKVDEIAAEPAEELAT